MESSIIMSRQGVDEEFHVSDYLKSAARGLHLPDRVLIFDTTLRDGEQTPGVTYTLENKVRIARQLEKLGVDVIEAGMPITSEGERRAVEAIAREISGSRVCALARPLRVDVDAALDCGIDYIHIFIATSDLHLKYKLKMTWEEVVEQSVKFIEYAKEHGVTVEFSAEDATRTDLGRLKEIYQKAVEAGADVINVPDTVGVMTPRAIYGLVREIKEAVDVPLSIHCHNDFGLATANSLAAVEAGAEQVHVCVNGLGERAGNASLEQVVMGLRALYGVRVNVKTRYLAETSDLVQRLSGIYLPPTTPIVGDNAFTHEAGIHVHGVLGQPGTYEPMTPELVGRRRRLVAGKHSGRHAIRAMVEEMGLHPSEEELREIYRLVKSLGDRGKTITDVELYGLATSVMDLSSQEKIRLKELTVVTGKNITSTASAIISYGGREFTESSTGVGPIDAAINAVKRCVKGFSDMELERFFLKAITGGTDALGDVTVRLRRGDKTVTSRGVSPDIVMASVEAIIRGMNRLIEMEEGED